MLQGRMLASSNNLLPKSAPLHGHVLVVSSAASPSVARIVQTLGSDTYIYIYIYTHTHTYIHNTYIHACMHTYVHIYIYIYSMCIYIYIYILLYCVSREQYSQVDLQRLDPAAGRVARRERNLGGPSRGDEQEYYNII